MEELMEKSIVTVAAAVLILSLGSLVSAQAGGAASAPSKYRTSASHPITETSSSSPHYAPRSNLSKRRRTLRRPTFHC
jgi:hypothetical protein